MYCQIFPAVVHSCPTVGDAAGNGVASEAPSQGITITLSCWLFRPQVSEPRQVLISTTVDDPALAWYSPDPRGGFSATTPVAADRAQSCLLVRSESAAPQGWQTLLARYLRVKGFQERPRYSSGAVLFMRGTDPEGRSRLIAWTFGSGHYLINRQLAEPRFGLLATFNALSKAAASIPRHHSSRRTVGVTKMRFNTRSGPLRRAEFVTAFPTRLDRLGRINTTDSPASVAGYTGADLIGSVQGDRAFRHRAKVASLEDLRRLAAEAIALYSADDYRAEHGWIDRYVEEEDERIIDQVLKSVWEGRTPDGRPVSVDIMWGGAAVEDNGELLVDHYRYRNEKRTKKEYRRTLTWPAIKQHFNAQYGAALSYREVFNERLRFFDNQDVEIGSASILELLSAEVHLGKQTYIISEGSVLRVAEDFLDSINQELEKRMGDLPLPPYTGGNELEYIRSLVQHPGWKGQSILLHGKLIGLSSGSSFEVCDVLLADGTLMHIKLKRRSSVLSHLWEQAIVSARLLRHEQQLRTKLQELIIDGSNDDELSMKIIDRVDELGQANHNWKIVFAIIGDRAPSLAKTLPAFSRVALQAACQHAIDLGFRPVVNLIPQASS